MPRSYLAGDRAEILRKLHDLGLFIFSGREPGTDVAAYLAHSSRDRFTSVASTGWHRSSFVLPDRVVQAPGVKEERYLLMNRPPVPAPRGTLNTWRTEVALRCRGNSRLQFAVSTSLASCLLQLAHMESGGQHFVGGSSLGKTSAAQVAVSPWGANLQQWRATDNGLEGIAARHSGIGLVIDEIGQSDPRMVGGAAYMLANGRGKGRANRDGSDRQAHEWHLLFLSTGETTLAEHMATGGVKVKTGQEIRLVNVEADAGVGMGLFENIHDDGTPARFANALQEAAAANNGTAGPAFVEYVVANRAKCVKYITTMRDRFLDMADVRDADGQVQRVAHRFALIATAGEIATRAKITGWDENEALQAALTCFDSWRRSWTPSGSREEERAVERVRAFVQQQAARFDPFDEGDIEWATRTRDRAGFIRRTGDAVEYLVFPNVFDTEVCTGLRASDVRRVLAERGLIRQSGGKNTVTLKPASMPKKDRFVVIRDAILDSHDDAAAEGAPDA